MVLQMGYFNTVLIEIELNLHLAKINAKNKYVSFVV